jgi:ESCRT-II complex subunit VPS36
MIKDEDKWINELAKELAGVLKGMMKDRGIIALDEVWGGWNRARGVGTFSLIFLYSVNRTLFLIFTFHSASATDHSPPCTSSFTELHLSTNTQTDIRQIRIISLTYTSLYTTSILRSFGFPFNE